MSPRILVTGATGNVGAALVAHLRRRGIAPILALRDPENHEGAVQLDFHRPDTFRSALVGVDVLFLVRPPAIARVRPTLCAFLDSAAAAGVRHVVFLSVVGAERSPMIPHRVVELHLQRSPLAWTLLRPGFFAQNIGAAYRDDLRERDELFLPAGHGRIAWVDARDLGELAAEILLDPGPHRGATYTLTGSEARDLTEVAALLTHALSREIRYFACGTLAYVLRLRARGLPLGQVAVLTLIHFGLRRDQQPDPTLTRLLGRPPRTVADYIADHTDLWRPPARTPRAVVKHR